MPAQSEPCGGCSYFCQGSSAHQGAPPKYESAPCNAWIQILWWPAWHDIRQTQKQQTTVSQILIWLFNIRTLGPLFQGATVIRETTRFIFQPRFKSWCFAAELEKIKQRGSQPTSSNIQRFVWKTLNLDQMKLTAQASSNLTLNLLSSYQQRWTHRAVAVHVLKSK